MDDAVKRLEESQRYLLDMCQRPTLDDADLSTLTKLIRSGINVNINGPMGMTPLLLLCWKNCSSNLENVAELLLQHGALVDQRNSNGWTALHLLFRYNQSDRLLKVVQLLNGYRIEIDPPNDKGASPLHLLCRYNQSDQLHELLSFLVDNGADVKSANKDGCTALHLLGRYNQSHRLVDLVQIFTKQNVCLGARSADGSTVLHNLCRFNHSDQLVDAIKLLVGQDASLVKCKTKDGRTALHFLCQFNHSGSLLEAARLLLQHGVEINARAGNVAVNLSNVPATLQRSIQIHAAAAAQKITALHLLCRYNQSHVTADVIRLFIQRKADVAAKDETGGTALHHICRHHRSDQLIDIIRLLIGQLNTNEQDNQGKTALDYVVVNASGQFHDIVDLFAQKEPNPRVSCELLRKAAQFGCWNVVRRFAARCHADGDVSLYLKRLRSDSFGLCPRCRKSSFNLAPLLISKTKKAPATFSRETLERSIPLNVERLVTEADQGHRTEIPSADAWKALVRSWHSNSPDLHAVQTYLMAHSHQDCHVGCKWCRTGSDVARFVQLLTENVKELDERLQVEFVVPNGSFWDKSRIWSPDHLDFVLVFRHFRQSEARHDHVTYTGPNRIDALLDPSRNIHPVRFAFYFGRLVTAAVEKVEDVHIFAPRVRYEDCDVIVDGVHRGKSPPALAVSIHLKMAVVCQEHLQVLNVLPAWCPKSVAYLTPVSEEGVPKWLLIYPDLERRLLSANGDMLKMFKLLKTLVALQTDSVQNVKPSSRVLKICLLRYLHINPPTSDNWKWIDAPKHCAGILRQYPIDRCEIDCSFQPDGYVLVDYQSRRTVLHVMQTLERVVAESTR